MGETKVIHVYSMQPGDVYIGRPMVRRGLTSKWGNPYKITATSNRAQVIECYRQYIMKRPDLLAALPELAGRRLACWCFPSPCHGDVLVELIKAARPGEGE